MRLPRSQIASNHHCLDTYALSTNNSQFTHFTINYNYFNHLFDFFQLTFSYLFVFLFNSSFKQSLDGKFILELARSKEGDRGWISVPRKTYWPPAALSQNNLNNHKNESSTSLSCKLITIFMTSVHLRASS